MSCLVYWFEEGVRLHRRADCPKLLSQLRVNSWAVAVYDETPRKLLQCDLDVAVTSSDDPYPPDDLEPCEVCG